MFQIFKKPENRDYQKEIKKLIKAHKKEMREKDNKIERSRKAWEVYKHRVTHLEENMTEITKMFNEFLLSAGRMYQQSVTITDKMESIKRHMADNQKKVERYL